MAKLAGVSRTAVSLVLNGRADGNISAATQDAIRAAARKLDYRPNAVAVSLRSQRTRTIGVVTDAIATHVFAGQVLSGAADAANQEGYLVLVVDEEDTARQHEAFRTLHHRRVDGLLFAALSLRPFHAPELFSEVPSALANCYEPDGAVYAVGCDEVGGGRNAASLLIEHGHREIAMLAGGPELVATHRRIEGYLAAVAAAELPVRPPITTGWTIDKGYHAAMSILADERRPTGIVCANDRVAVGVLLAAARLGLEVPRDLSVVGYDDEGLIASDLVPALTTVRLPHYDMGRLAMESVLRQIHGETVAPEQVLLTCPVVVRESVAPAPR